MVVENIIDKTTLVGLEPPPIHLDHVDVLVVVGVINLHG